MGSSNYTLNAATFYNTYERPYKRIYHSTSLNTSGKQVLLRQLRPVCVVHHPRGRDRGISIPLEHTHTRGHWDVPLSQLQEYVAKYNLPAPLPMTANADAVAVQDFHIC